jgi:hypothetical protein
MSASRNGDGGSEVFVVVGANSSVLIIHGDVQLRTEFIDQALRRLLRPLNKHRRKNMLSVHVISV